MKIGSIGYNYVHDMKYENFIMDRPKGPGAVLLLLIKTPAVFKVGGVQYQVKENSFILMSAVTIRRRRMCIQMTGCISRTTTGIRNMLKSWGYR